MKILLDVLTPKQALFFSRLSQNLRRKNHEVFMTTRKYREVLQTIRMLGVDAQIVGEHGGNKLVDKLRASLLRTLDLASLLEKIEPNVAVSFSSPEMARASYGLGVPHICVNDSPHAEAVAKLTLPLSERLLTPFVIRKKDWTKYGISQEKIVQYKALDPWVWLRNFKPDRRILEELKLDKSKPVLTFRTEETKAAYLLNRTRKEISIIPIIEKVWAKRKDVQIVALPRYEDQIADLRRNLKGRVVVPRRVIDATSLLYYTSVFVGAGGTMTAEAALLGVPTFSCYPSEPYIIEKYLIKKRLVTRETDPEKIGKLILRTLDNCDHVKQRKLAIVQELVKTYEDPIEPITREIERFL